MHEDKLLTTRKYLKKKKKKTNSLVTCLSSSTWFELTIGKEGTEKEDGWWGLLLRPTQVLLHKTLQHAVIFEQDLDTVFKCCSLGFSLKILSYAFFFHRWKCIF